MDMQNDIWPQLIAKARAIHEHQEILGIAATSIIKDEEGQIKWSAVLTGGLTAGLIAAATSLFSVQQTLTELRTKYEGRAAQVEMIPAIAERQRFVLEELTAIRTEKAAATSDRFRGSDAQRLEERLQRHIDSLDRRIDELEKGKKR
jgi:gas vesicle protein